MNRPSLLRIYLELLVVTVCGVAFSALMYSDVFKACCKGNFVGTIIGMLFLPGVILAWLIGGGPHGATPTHFTIGLVVELLFVWACLRLFRLRHTTKDTVSRK